MICKLYILNPILFRDPKLFFVTSTTAFTTETTTTVASTTTECLYIGDHDLVVTTCPTTKRKKRFLAHDVDESFLSRIETQPSARLRY